MGFPAVEVHTQLQLAFSWLGTGDLEPGQGIMEKEPSLGFKLKTGHRGVVPISYNLHTLPSLLGTHSIPKSSMFSKVLHILGRIVLPNSSLGALRF